MTDTHAIDIVSVTKVYPHRTDPVLALDDISFSIGDNEFFTLLGPSGCGKTTLLRMIGGFEDITKGQILLFGDDISRLQSNQRPVNTVFQQYALFPHLTVFENVAFGLKRLGRDADFIKSQTTAMLELIRMAEFAERKPSQLSGGQQQRVALARALAPQPKVLLLDEPLSALDLKLRQAMREELKEIQKHTGITFIFVTHDQEEALTMSDRIAVMSNGQVQQIGSPKEIYDNPINTFVANFIGEANILKAKVTGPATKKTEGKNPKATSKLQTKPSLRVDLDSGIKGLNIISQAEFKKGQHIDVMIRPERVQITPLAKARRNGNSIRGTVKSISYLGTDTQIQLMLDDGESLLARLQNTIDASSSFAVGNKVDVTIPEIAIRALAE
jgi:spermidine/putrescine transport system ATP-binding protein